MISLHALSALLTSIDAELFGEVVRDSARKLEVIAVSGAKDHFTQARTPEGTPWKPIRPRVNGGDKPLRDKGLLMASISASVTEGELRLKASHPGANVHQFGATIRPKRAKKLAIPVSREAKRSGRPRDFPRKLKWRPTNGDTSLLYEVTGKRVAKVVIHFILVDEVTIEARKYLGFSAETIGKLMFVLASEFDRMLLEKITRARDESYRNNPIIY